MSSTIEMKKLNSAIPLCYSSIYPHNALLNLVTRSILTAFQWEAILFRTLLYLNNTARNVLPSTEKETFPQLKRPEEIINQLCWEKVDVNNIENLKTMEQAGKKKSKKKKKAELERERRQKELAEAAARRQAEEAERLRKWEEAWEQKCREEEERNQAECCAGRDLCVKPRTQSNIWINVTRDRSIQEIHMTFKHVPVPRPKPPPLPPLKIQRPVNIASAVQKENLQKVDRMNGTEQKKGTSTPRK